MVIECCNSNNRERIAITHSEIVSFIWGIADLIRDTFKRGKYQDVILPLTVLRRLDCVLEAVIYVWCHFGVVLAPKANISAKQKGFQTPGSLVFIGAAEGT